MHIFTPTIFQTDLTWTGTFLPIIVIVALAVIIRIVIVLALRSWVKITTNRNNGRLELANNKAFQVLSSAAGLDSERYSARIKTVTSLIKSITDVVLVAVVVLTVLALLNVPLAPLLTSAGIGGIAIAFGAQSLVKDYLSGLFIVFEDQFGVGDVITVGDISGTVQEVTLRITRIQDISGQVWYVRNGEILTLGNQSQGWASAAVDIFVFYDSDTDQVSRILKKVADTFGQDDQWADVLLEPPSLWGLSAIEGQQLKFQLGIKTRANQQWAAARALRTACIQALTKAGVKGPVQLIQTEYRHLSEEPQQNHPKVSR